MSFEIRELTFHYGCRARWWRPAPAPVLRQLSTTIPGGRITALMGVSGVGKSTLLSLLGLQWQGQPEKGQILYRDRDGRGFSLYARLPARARVRLRQREFGFIYQDGCLLPALTCGDNLALPLVLQGLSEPQRRAWLDDVLQRAAPSGELKGLVKRYAGQVSGGQQARLAALRGLIHDPQVAFADEPFAKLDDLNRQHLLDLFTAWHQGELHPGKQGGYRTLILVCHDHKVAHGLADHFLILYRKHPTNTYRFLVKADVPKPTDLLDLLKEEQAC